MTNSPTPGTPQTPNKSVSALISSAIVTFVGFWILDTDPFTSKEIAQAGVAALIGSGLVGAVTYQVQNKPK